MICLARRPRPRPDLRFGWIYWIWALFAVAAPGAVAAHALNPALLLIDESAPDLFAVSWKQNVSDDSEGGQPGVIADCAEVVLPSACIPVDARRGYTDAGVRRMAWSVRCAGGISGGRVMVRGLGRGVPEALVRISLLDGTQVSGVVRPGDDSLAVSRPPRGPRILTSYVVLGVEHILTGFDHLAFLVVLLLLVRTPRRMLVSITAFTVAHSFTLALATLRLVHYPTALVEAWIALSILVVAAELRRGPVARAIEKSGSAVDEDAGSSIARRPWIAAFAFGLLHGFGFAGALAEIGLPQAAIPLALVSFNVGVELGQLVFLVGVMALVTAWCRFMSRVPVALVTRLVVDGVGVLAAYWTWQRLAAAIS